MAKITVKGIQPIKKVGFTAKMNTYPGGSGRIKTIKERQAEEGQEALGTSSKTPVPAVGTKSKNTTYKREVEVTKEKTPKVEGKLYLKPGTVQRKASGSGVNFVEDEDPRGTITDPKSRVKEGAGQRMLRDSALDMHKNIDLSQRYKAGDRPVYDTKKGPQVFGEVRKLPDTPATYETVKQKQVQVKTKGDIKDIYKDASGRSITNSTDLAANRKRLSDAGYRNQPGTNKYIKDEASDWVDEDKVGDQTLSGGDATREQAKKRQKSQDIAIPSADKKAKGTKKVMSLKKYC